MLLCVRQERERCLCRLWLVFWAAQTCPRSALRTRMAWLSQRARPEQMAWESSLQQKGTRAPLRGRCQVLP